MKVSRSGRLVLNLIDLESRVVPATTYTWVGGTDIDWMTAANWDPQGIPGTQPTDRVILSGTRANAPTIDTGVNRAIEHIDFQNSATFDLTIIGTLSTKGSRIFADPDHPKGFVGSGGLFLDDTAAAGEDHVWDRGYVKVRTAAVVSGAVLEVRWTFGQLGPDTTGEGAESNWYVGDFLEQSEGTLLLNGEHYIGFDTLSVGPEGKLLCETGGWLRDVMFVEEGLPPGEKFLIANYNRVEIAEGQVVTLQGGWYQQAAYSGSNPVTIFNPTAGLSIRNFDGMLGDPPAYSVDVLAGKVVAYENATISSLQTDIRIQDATIEYFNPGNFTRNGVNGGSSLTLSAQYGQAMKEVLIKNTPIKFLDWNPAGRYTATTQVGASLSVNGNLKLDGATELSIRVNISGLTSDKVVETNPAGSITFNGNALKFAADLRNPPMMPGIFPVMNFVSAPSLTCPSPPFGGGETYTGAAGFTKEIIKDGNTLDLKLTKTMM